MNDQDHKRSSILHQEERIANLPGDVVTKYNYIPLQSQ